MNRKIMIRTVLGLFLVAALIFGYSLFTAMVEDPDFGNTDTTGWLAAIEHAGDGSRLVVFDQDGKRMDVPGHEAGIQDHDPVWRPDGQRLFFVSNRDGDGYNIQRWNFSRNEVVSRTEGDLSKSKPWFGPEGHEEANETALFTQGGNVLVLNQSSRKLYQLLPPKVNRPDGGQQGAKSQFDEAFEKIGTSFKYAKWGKDRLVVYAVMRREDGSEVFIVNPMVEFGQMQAMPYTIVAGEKVDFELTSNDDIILTVKNQQVIDFEDANLINQYRTKDRRAVLPWSDGVFAMRVVEEGIVPPIPLFVDQPMLEAQLVSIDVARQPIVDENGVVAGPGPFQTIIDNTNLPDDIRGVIVSNIMEGSFSFQFGFKNGDIITAVNGQEVYYPGDIHLALSEVEGDEPVHMNYIRLDGPNPIALEQSVPFPFYGFDLALDVAVSPDGLKLAVSIGKRLTEYEFEPQFLLLADLGRFGLHPQVSTVLARGRILQPTWSHDGQKIAYLKASDSGERELYTINVNGSDETLISTDGGDFSDPEFSPGLTAQ